MVKSIRISLLLVSVVLVASCGPTLNEASVLDQLRSQDPAQMVLGLKSKRQPGIDQRQANLKLPGSDQFRIGIIKIRKGLLRAFSAKEAEYWKKISRNIGEKTQNKISVYSLSQKDDVLRPVINSKVKLEYFLTKIREYGNVDLLLIYDVKSGYKTHPTPMTIVAGVTLIGLFLIPSQVSIGKAIATISIIGPRSGRVYFLGKSKGSSFGLHVVASKFPMGACQEPRSELLALTEQSRISTRLLEAARAERSFMMNNHFDVAKPSRALDESPLVPMGPGLESIFCH